MPVVRYVSIGHYDDRYPDAAVDNRPHIREEWGVRVVFLSGIPQNDWERGARGQGNFWELVEQEAKTRLTERLVD